MNDTRIASKAKAQLANFMGKVFTHFSRPGMRFIEECIYGIQASGDTKLTSIVRAIDDGIRPIYTEKRLSRNLDDDMLEQAGDVTGSNGDDDKLPLLAAKRDIPFASRGISTSRQRGYPLSDKGDIPFHGKGISPFTQGGYPLSDKGDIPFSSPEGGLARSKNG